MKQLIVIFILMLSVTPIVLKAQVTDGETGTIVYVQDERLDDLYDLYLDKQSESGTIEGYRIQIISGPNRDAVYKVKTKFYTKFPDQRPYVVYQQPNFKLRVGNFRSRIEAYKVFTEIEENFPGAFIIRDNIKLSEL